MDLIDILLSAGIATVLGACVYIGRKLQMLDDLKKTTDKIKLNVKVIGDYLTTSNADFNATELQAYSPIQLTEEGRKLIDELGLDDICEQNSDDFFHFIDSMEPKLKYDVEVAAIQSIYAVYEQQEYMDFLKVFFYNNPKRHLKNTAPTLGIYVRDKYLEQHPEITE